MISAPRYLSLTVRLRREYCAVVRNSLIFPCGVLLKGIEAKDVAMLLCVLVVRKIFSRSTNPPGVRTASPILKPWTGDCAFS